MSPEASSPLTWVMTTCPLYWVTHSVGVDLMPCSLVLQCIVCYTTNNLLCAFKVFISCLKNLYGKSSLKRVSPTGGGLRKKSRITDKNNMISHIEKHLYFKAHVHRWVRGLQNILDFFAADDMYFRKFPHSYSIEWIISESGNTELDLSNEPRICLGDKSNSVGKT